MSEDDKEVSIANEIWILDDCLLWPPKNLIKLPQRKLLNSVPDENWSRILEFTVLQRGIKSIKEANERLNFYCLYDNTRDKIQADAAKALQRLHPVQYIENHLDYNSLFDDLNGKQGSTSTPNSSLVVTKKQKNVKSELPCGLCGDPAGIIKCTVCKPDVFCGSCDTLYHKHPLRQKHSRQKIKVSSSQHNHQARTKKVTSTKSATVTKTVNAAESIQTEQIATNNSQVLPILSMQKQLAIGNNLKNAVPSTASGNSSFAKRKINESDGVESNDCVLKRERELQALSGDSNNIPDNNARTAKKQAIKKNVKTPRVIRSAENNKDASPGITDRLLFTAALPHASDNNTDRILFAPAIGNNKMPKKIENIEIKTICVMCGSAGQIQCDQCSSMILCVTCDNQYHRHMLRSHHKRQIMTPRDEIEDKIQQKTENIAKPETETSGMASAEATAALSNRVNRPPLPPLILMTRESIVSEGSSRADDEGASDLNQNLESNEELNDDSFVFSYEDNQEKLNDSADSLPEIDHVASVPESHKNENLDIGVMSNTEPKTTTSEIQQKEENPRNQRNPRNIKRRRITRARNPFNKQMFLKMFVAIKAIKKNQGIMMVAINDMKRQQVGLRNKITQANAEIQVIKELINNNYQTAKKEITIDKTFIVPKMGIGRVVSAVALEKSCKNSTYCDQLAVRFKKYTAINIKDIKPAIKRIMEIIFAYELIMLYSWTGKSELNSGTDQKLKFSILTGIQSMIAKAATLNLPSSVTIDNLCIQGIKDVVRRASQNWSRQNR